MNEHDGRIFICTAIVVNDRDLFAATSNAKQLEVMLNYLRAC